MDILPIGMMDFLQMPQHMKENKDKVGCDGHEAHSRSEPPRVAAYAF